MGYDRHHAIIVSSFTKEEIQKAHQKAKDMFGEIVSDIIESKLNHWVTFFIAPDGSKEGWEDSDLHDSLRHVYIDWLKKQTYGDDSSWLDWAEIQYGDDEDENLMLKHSGDKK